MTIGLFEPIFIEELFDYRIVNNGKRGRPLSLLETAGLVTNAPKGEAMDKLACASIIIFLNRPLRAAQAGTIPTMMQRAEVYAASDILNHRG